MYMFEICTYNFANVCTRMYMVCTKGAINVYLHRSNMYVHVYVLILNYINIYIHCSNVFMQCFIAHVGCTARIIHFMNFTDIAEPSTYISETGAYIPEPCRIQLFIRPVCLPVTWDWLLPTQFSSTQV
jgi:hypothetical protein